MSRTVLLISPDPGLHRGLRRAVDLIDGCDCVWYDGKTPQLEEIVEAAPAIVLAHMAGASASRSYVLSLIETLASQARSIPTIVIADSFNGPSCRKLLAAGARECLVRPIDVPRLKFFIEAELVSRRAKPTPSLTRLELAAKSSGEAFRAVCRKAELVAQKSTTVLLTGETGVGKTYMARLMHDASPRANQPFVALNCGAISEHLAESEMFGHKKGAFTGATEDYGGHFAASGKGTLFLDEVDSLTLAMQAKLLRALDDGMYEPVGSVSQRRLESRLIAATSRPIEQAVVEGAFRKDLLYRLRVVALELPPLRQRRGEIRDLARSFIQEICDLEQTAMPTVPEETWKRLESHDWPGNLRELRNALQHAFLFLQDGILHSSHLPELEKPPIEGEELGVARQSTAPAVGASPVESRNSLKTARQQAERHEILQVLIRCANNKSHAARELGISRNGFYKRLKTLGL